MTEPEDLRGRHFTWHASETNVSLIEDPIEVGLIFRPIEQPTFFADFAGLRLRLDHSVGVLGPTFEVRDADYGTLLMRSHYTREAELRVQTDESLYRLRLSAGVALWNDGTEDAVSFRAQEAFVMLGANPIHAPALVLLGIVMAIENTLFPASALR